MVRSQLTPLTQEHPQLRPKLHVGNNTMTPVFPLQLFVLLLASVNLMQLTMGLSVDEVLPVTDCSSAREGLTPLLSCTA